MSHRHPPRGSERRSRTGIAVRVLVPALSVVLLALSSIVPFAYAADSVASLRGDLKKQIVAGDSGSAISTIDQLFAHEDPDAAEAIASFGFVADDTAIERHIIRRIRDLPADHPFIPVFAEQLRDHKDFRARVALVIALEERGESSAWGAVVSSIFDRQPSVQLSALEAIRDRDDIQTVDYLIDALRREEKSGRAGALVSFEIRKTLTSLTNENFEFAEDWEVWWRANKKDFKRPPKDSRTNGATAVKRDPPLFFGIELNTERVLFLLDVSGSMSKRDPSPEEGSEGGDPPPSRERLKRVQAELIQVINKLPDRTLFDIVTFNHKIERYKGELVRASARSKRQAIDYVNGFKAEGETHTDTAFETAFDYPEVDTIFLLSDGAPRRDNELLDRDAILDWLRDSNRFRRVRIHAVTFEQCGKSLRKFMREIARRNQGEYKELR